MNAIVAKAREYIGTPYRHQGRVKGHGVDCVGLALCVAWELGIKPKGFDFRGYRRLPDGVTLLALMNEHLVHIEREEMRPGDLLCMAFVSDPQHVGILGDHPSGELSLIHAASKNKKVVEERLVFGSSLKFVAAFRYPQ